jgi:hypothetical protein
MGNFSNSIVGSDAYKKAHANSNMQAVQVYESSSVLDLPKMTDKQWDSMTKEQQEHQLAWEAKLVKACEGLYVEASKNHPDLKVAYI